MLTSRAEDLPSAARRSSRCALLTVRRPPLYIGYAFHSPPVSTRYPMTTGSKDRLELVALESRVDELIKAVESLATENEALRSQQASLTAERAALIEKTEQARSRVEAMIARLKAMETRS